MPNDEVLHSLMTDLESDRTERTSVRGAHVEAVRMCYREFNELARQIAGQLGIASEQLSRTFTATK